MRAWNVTALAGDHGLAWVAQRNPGELFRHNARQWEGFSKLVAWDEAGFYWMKRA